LPFPENFWRYSSTFVTNKLTLSDEWNRQADFVALLQQSEQYLGVVLTMQVTNKLFIFFGQIKLENGVNFGGKRGNEGLKAY